MWIVQIALRRPYTFVVLSLLIALFGIRAALFTPTDIFPNINIPVISVVWTYNGLLPADMSGRVIYYYERTLSAQVGDIEHIESQSLNGYGVVKIFFQKEVDIAAAMAQVTAASQTVLKLLPPGITPPYVLSYNASSVPILQLALSSRTLPQMNCSTSDKTSSGRSSPPSRGRRCRHPMVARFCRYRSISTSRRCRRMVSRPRTSSMPFRRRT